MPGPIPEDTDSEAFQCEIKDQANLLYVTKVLEVWSVDHWVFPDPFTGI